MLSPELITNFLPETNISLCMYPVTKEAVVQYEQYEQEVKNLQRLIEEAHRIIQDRPVSTSNIQELQAQIQHHEVRLPGSKAFTQNFALQIIMGIVWSVHCE